MKFLLDTNVCIQFITGRSLSVKNKIENCPPGSLIICSIVRSELEYGARKSREPSKTLFTLRKFLANFQQVDFDKNAAERYGVIRANLETQGLVIGPYDMQIAAIAIANNLTLITHNMKEFNRIEGLQLQD